MKKKILIEGMSCGHCVKHVKNALTDLNGVKAVEVILDTKTALVDIDEEVSEDAIKAAIEDAGYEVTEIITE